MNIIEFETQLAEMRLQLYRHPQIDIVNKGFRPVSGKVADFAVAEKDGTYHFFYIERRLTEATPFYPGNEIYFGHASTADFINWEVHDPVLLIQPETWEGAHVWAPDIILFKGRYVMAYTGVNKYLSQNIGLAFSEDLFEWNRSPSNPVSPSKSKGWSFWRENGIASCRDPHLVMLDNRLWMAYTANTREGAACIALCSSEDLETWKDHGPILVGPAQGYEPRLEGGHPQGSLESCNLLSRDNRWFLLVKASVRETTVKNWIIESDTIHSFDFANGREFWHGALGTEVVATRDHTSLLACFAGGTIRFGETDWSHEAPTAQFVSSLEQLERWSNRS